MSHSIPKEKMTAYQRWELASFDIEPPPVTSSEVLPEVLPDVPPAETEPLASAIETLPEEPPLALPTAEEIERVHHEAHTAGYTAGYSTGYAAGYATGHEEGIKAAQAVATDMASLMEHLQQALATIDQDVAEQLLVLAIEIANQVLRQSLHVQPELILPVVREAVTALHPHHGQPLLFVHPDDAALVRSHLGEQLAHANWRIIDDKTLSAGGCRVELGASEVDATLETRWRRVIEAIGVNQEWLKARA